MKIQNNKASIKYVMAALMLSAILLMSNTNVFALTSSVKHHSHPEMPLYAQKLQEKIDEQTDLHPGWMGIITWNSTGAEIKYLGLASSNPYKIDKDHWHNYPSLINEKKQTTVRPLTTSYPVLHVYQSILNHYSTGGNSIYEEEQSFPLVASSTSGTNLYHFLNAKNSNDGEWLQVAAVYDKALLFGSSPAWYVDFDGWITGSCSEDATNGYPFQMSAGAFTTGTTATGYIRADGVTQGKYYMGVINSGQSVAATVTLSGDTGTSIKIDSTSNLLCGVSYPSGAEDEEWGNSSTSSYFFYNPITYSYTFYDTSSSSPNTYVYNYDTQGGDGGSVTANTGNNANVQISCTNNGLGYC